MAEELGQNRTEDPTPRRREDARKKGHVAFSAELTAAAVVLVSAIFLLVTGPSMGNRLIETFRGGLAYHPSQDLDVSQTQSLAWRVFGQFVSIAGFFFGILIVAAVAVCLAQVGFHVIPDRLGPDFEKISPSVGLQRLVSLQSVQRLLLALAKAAVLIIVAALVLRSRSGVIPSLGRGSVQDAVSGSWAICIRLMVALAGALLVLGIIDYFVNWRRFETSLRMTRQELKEEIKRDEGDPLIKARIRQLQQQIARQRIRTAVPKSTVVITNPTHYAVALRYDQGSSLAPVVTAKGAGVHARQIIDIARRHAVPVIERPEVARAIYASVREGQEIPPVLFRAVAEVIAFVFRLRGAA